MIKKLLFILFSLGSALLIAGTGPKNNYPLNGNGFIINNNTNQVIHQAIVGGTINWATHVNSAQEFYSFNNTLELYQYESAALPVNFEYDLTINGKLEYYQLGSTSLASQTIALHINNKQQGSSRRIDFYNYSNAYNSKFTITSVVLTGTPPSGGDLYSEVSKIVELNFSIQKTHFKQPDLNLTPIIWGSPCIDNTSNELVLGWQTVAFAEEYELEVLYVDDYDANGAAINPLNVLYDFRENATRIVLKQLFYRLPLVYDRGYILYRVRPVGRGGPLWDKRIPGLWSSGAVSGSVNNFTNKKYISTNEIHTLNKINWNLTTTYADDGKRKDVVQYSDGLYMARQTVTGVSETKNIFTQNSNDNGIVPIPCASQGSDKLKEIIAQETTYDFNGRVGVQILPVPTGTHKVNYIPHLNQNMSGQVYSWKDFDILSTCNLPAGALKQSTTGAFGAGQYYSSNNPNKIGYNAFIPDAAGFPFSRVQYLDDNTGRVHRQGGLSADFQLGSDHETKFFYGAPNQVELNRMFGTEVGYAKRYLKKMVVDPNGQTSVTYENPAGKIIATALTGDKPDNLLPLDNETQAAVEIDVDIMADSSTDNFSHCMSINKQFLVPAKGQYIFNYSVKGQTLNYLTCNKLGVCLDCIYDLVITLHSNDGCTVLPVFNYSGTFGDLIKQSKLPHINNTCYDANQAGAAAYENKPANFPTGFTATLEQGSYTLEKKLTVNKNAAEAYVDLVFTDTCKTMFDSILQNELSRIDTADCSQSCASCKDSFPNSFTAECEAMCVERQNDCDHARKTMLADLKPGGQYAQFSVNSTGKYYSADPLSIFNPSCQLHANPGLAAIVNLNSTNITDSLYINNCINNWSLTTAEEDILLQSHPEYCMLQWCNTQNTGKDYDLKLLTTKTFAEAVTAGIISNGSTPAATYIQMLNNDPFFPNPGVNYNDFLAFMNNVCSTGNLLQMAMHAAYCSSSPDMLALTNAILNNPGGPQSNITATVPPCQPPAGYLTTHIFGSDPATKEMEWKMLRDLYISYKEKYLYNSRRDYSINNGCFNGCIGAQNFFFMPTPLSFTGNGYPNFFGNNSAHNGYSYSAEGNIPVNTSDACGTTYALYKNKVKHFTNRYDAFSHTTSQTPVNLTGIDLYNNCPTLTNVTSMQSQVSGITSQFLCDTFHVVQAKDQCPINDFISMLNRNLPRKPGEIVTLEGSQVPEIFNSSSGSLTEKVNKIKIDYSTNKYVISFYSGNAKPQKIACEISVPVPKEESGFVSQICCPVYGQPLNGSMSFSLTVIYSNGVKRTVNVTTKCPEFMLCNTSGSVATGTGASPASGTTTSKVTPVASDPIKKEKGKPPVNKDREPVVAVKPQKEIAKEKETKPKPPLKPDTCKTLSPFADELFSFLSNIKNPKEPMDGKYTFKKRRSSLYARFSGSSAIRYSYTQSKECRLQYTGQGARMSKDSACTITFANCRWKDASVALVSIKPYFDNNSSQTNKFILTCIDKKTGQTFIVNGASNCLPINECKSPLLCKDDSLFMLPVDTTNFNSCVEAKYLLARDNAFQQYAHLIDSLRNDLLQKYYAKCMNATETFRYKYTDKQFHYTLYYYDQAGNLTRTIPPAGVRLLDTIDMADVNAKRIANAGTKVPLHTFITNYKYNSLNQLNWQTTPDAGRSSFYYDKLGRIAASQNAKQQPLNNYSYTYYDILGRIVESGELANTLLNQSTIDNYANWKTFIHTPSRMRLDITYSKYDEAYNAAINNKFGAAGQQNLRGRVAGIFSFADNTSQTNNNYRHATHFTYDVNGNVPLVLQDYPNTLIGDKVIAYKFDLVSGKVNEVRYQPGLQDEFRHKYSYDDELRLKSVYTSRKSGIWERDAEYFYYKHGPLARTELGHLKVQGLDYIYTLQGWIKGVNGTDGDVKQDAGRDGIALENGVPGTAIINGQSVNTNVESDPNLNSTGPGYHSYHSTVAADAFGYVLNYYGGDYKPIAAGLNTTTAMNTPMAGVQPLYNGNINRTFTYLQTLGGLGMNYSYDQLNRLKDQQAFTFSGSVPSPLNAYSMKLSYDGNGNIITLERDGRSGNTAMDNLTYRYYDANNVEIPNMATPPANATNRLASVQDAITSGYPETGTPLNGTVTDIDNQNVNNYSYDAIGNLTKDNAEGIQNIKWNLLNKISEIDKTTSQLYFNYDASGNRVSKKYVTGITTTETFYVRDASGTVMGTYELKDAKLTWKEQDLYGSSRLGLWAPDQLITANAPKWNGTVDWQNIQSLDITEDSLIRGSKQYELSNHLSNVLATISDRRLQSTPALNGTSGAVADLRNANDYYGFGMQIPGRSSNLADYRYGFNGQENDNEVKGDGNEIEYGMRTYDPRLGRFFSTDPVGQIAPWSSPYSFAGNTPIWAIDLNGMYPVVRTATLNGITYTFRLDTETPQDMKISGDGDKFGFTFHSEKKARQSMELLKNQYSDVINTTISKKDDDYVSKDVKKMSTIIHKDVDIGELVTALLEQNPDLKLLIVGNHAIPKYLPFKSSTGSISRDGTTNEEDWQLQKDFTLKRAQTIRNTYFQDAPNVTPLSQADAREFYPGIELKPLGKEAVGITIFFDFSSFPKTDPSSKPKNEKKKTNESHMNVRFL